MLGLAQPNSLRPANSTRFMADVCLCQQASQQLSQQLNACRRFQLPSTLQQQCCWQVLMNGSLRARKFKRLMAYVPQEDSFEPTLYAWETLDMHAQLRLPNSTSRAERVTIMEDALHAMGLWKARQTQVGVWEAAGLGDTHHPADSPWTCVLMSMTSSWTHQHKSWGRGCIWQLPAALLQRFKSAECRPGNHSCCCMVLCLAPQS